MNFSRVLTVGIIGLVALLPGIAFAYQQGNPQTVRITIGRDFIGKGVWSLPLAWDHESTSFYIPEFVSYGEAVSTNYKLTSAQQTFSKKIVPAVQVQDEVLAIAHDPADTSALQNYDLSYTLTPYFKQPVAIYEIWIAGNGSRINPTVNITYPADWKILSNWPADASTSPGMISIAYPQANVNIQPVIIAFQTNSGGVVQQYGKYTITGTSDGVQKIIEALGKITNIDQVMDENLGIQTPDKVLIVSENLSAVGQIGYEAEAIAANPNIILFNNQLTKSKTTNEIAELLSHEMTHLAMLGRIKFQDRAYRAPFFDEGIAVYFQGLMHRKIFTLPSERILDEELNRTHLVSPSEANVLYESAFDTDFDGNRALGTGASYMHAGLVFGRFADVAGQAGFKKLYSQIKDAKPYSGGDDSDTIFDMLSAISGLSIDKLKFPGKSERSVDSIVGRISHPDNDADTSADVVTAYVKTGIKHYFSSGTSTVVPPAQPAVVRLATTTTPVATSKIVLTKNLLLGSAGPEVTQLQTFLVSKGFLTISAGLSKGYFGKVTKTALIAYQKSVGLAPTGTVGPKTRASINASL